MPLFAIGSLTLKRNGVTKKVLMALDQKGFVKILGSKNSGMYKITHCRFYQGGNLKSLKCKKFSSLE